MKNKSVVGNILAGISLMASSMTSFGDTENEIVRTKLVKGFAVTGHNNIKGEPYFTWGEPYGTFNFPTMGIHNAEGSDPLPVTPSTPMDSLVATAVDPGLLIVSGKTPDYVVPPEWINVLLRDVPVNIDFGFVETAPLEAELNVPPLVNAQAEPALDITLGDWLTANGKALIQCKGDTATVDITLNDMIPNRMYSLWGTLGLPRDGSAQTFFPIPLGGAPNIVFTDDKGHAEYKRNMNFCPLDTESTLRPLLTVNVQYHANHQNYGAVPEPGFIDGMWLGLITFNHLQFPVNVDLLN